MKVHVLNGLGEATTLDATRVLVTTDSGTPLAFSVELLPGLVENGKVEDDGFAGKLRAHGIDRSVQVGTLRAPRIEDFNFQV